MPGLVQKHLSEQIVVLKQHKGKLYQDHREATEEILEQERFKTEQVVSKITEEVTTEVKALFKQQLDHVDAKFVELQDNKHWTTIEMHHQFRRKICDLEN